MESPRLLPTAILITVLALIAESWLTRPNPVVPASAPESVFSGGRALTLLKEFLAEDMPHPVGSPANRRIKERIQSWLDEQGISHEEQDAWACSARSPSCAYVENIIARVPGELSGPYVAMMAHYDSVPTTSGAGDDMAGVVALLETARALKATGGFRHPVLILITDSEETGLHGAEAFFQKHPLASEIAVLLNLEGSGTRGRSQVLRTSAANAWYMKEFSASAAQPAGTSLANEVFKHMPNDTDFSVAMAAKIPGIDFSFAGERNHYHTLNDNPENLDPRTIQHHGDNLYPLVRRLANSDLGAAHGGNVVYQQSFGLWLQWPPSLTWILLAVAGAALFAASVRSQATATQWVLSILVIPLLVLIGGGGLVHLCFFLIERTLGTLVDWPARLWPFRLVVFAGVLLPALVMARGFVARLPAAPVQIGAWWLIWLLTVGLTAALPETVTLFVIALVPVSLWLALLAWLPVSDGSRNLLAAASLAFPALFLSAALLLEETQGFNLFPAIWPPIALFATTAMAFARGRWLGAVSVFTALTLLLGLAATVFLPLYSTQRPQHLNVWHLQNADAKESLAYLWPGALLPEAVQNAAAFETNVRGAMPWTDTPFEHIASVADADLPAPTLIVEEEQRTDQGRELKLRLRSERDASQLRLYLPAQAGDWRGSIDGSPVASLPGREGQPRRVQRLRIHGVQDREVVLTLFLDSLEPVDIWLVDMAPQLPAATRAIADARPVTAVPAHSGDQSMVYRKVTL
ncbi:MAG: M20/M25/M40 family metallo-hydrolase [Pseudomonadota bacterium]